MAAAGQGYEAHRENLPGRDRAIELFFHQQEILRQEVRADGNDHAAARLEQPPPVQAALTGEVHEARRAHRVAHDPVDCGLGVDLAYQGVLITLITLVSYIIGHCMEVGYFEMPKGVSDDGMTMAFLTMSMCEIFHSFNMRSQRKSVFSLPSHNKVLWGAMLGSLVLTTLVLEVPVIANAFGFTPVSWTEYGIALALAILVIPIVELVKFFQRRAARRKAAK